MVPICLYRPAQGPPFHMLGSHGRGVLCVFKTCSLCKVLLGIDCQGAKLHARIKPTALCSVLDKENSIKSSLDFLHYLYNYYMVCVLFSHAYHVTRHVTSCDVML